MKKTLNRGRINQSLHHFYKRHGYLIEIVGNGFGIAAGIAWLLGFFPAAPSWTWPVTAGLAVLAAILALYRAQEIEISRRELKEANQRLIALSGDQIVRGIEQFARDAETRQQLPIVGMAGLLQTLRLIQQDTPGGVHPQLDQAMAALAEYEKRATGGVEH